MFAGDTTQISARRFFTITNGGEMKRSQTRTLLPTYVSDRNDVYTSHADRSSRANERATSQFPIRDQHKKSQQFVAQRAHYIQMPLAQAAFESQPMS
jgi:hypothetical protein